MPHPHDMQPTPTTRRLPERRSRTPFYTVVACSSLVLGLLLGVGGYFGVRALEGDPERPTDSASATAGGTAPSDGGSSNGGSSNGGDGPTETAVATAPETLAETPVGKDQAVALGTAVPMRHFSQDIPVEIRISGVDWDATQELHDANTFNEAPGEGEKHILVTVEGVNRGARPLDASSPYWLTVTHVAEDGTEHGGTGLVTPRYDEITGQTAVEVDGTFIGEYSLTVPEDLSGSGYFVLTTSIDAVEDGVWVAAA